ncbi:MAG: hypothetical protein WCL70_07690 [Paludibacter sp.]
MKHFVFLFFCILLTSQLVAQESVSKDKITLLTGEIYIGNIYAKTDELVMIKTENGKRYQFMLSQVKRIEKTTLTSKDSNKNTVKSSVDDTSPGYFCGNLEISGGISSAKNAFSSIPNTEVSMVFGKNNISGKNLFFGLGASYQMLFTSVNTQPVRFIPAFMRLQKTFLKSKTSPFVGIDAGYSFGLSPGYGGGPFVKTFVGIVRKINYKSDFYADVFGGVSSINTALTETNDLGVFHYNGPTTMTTIGLRVGFHF